MSEVTAIAKPYATAAFEIALEKKALKKWQTFLQKAAYLTQQEDIKRLLHDPRINFSATLECFFDLLKSDMDDQAKNFLLLLGEYARLDELRNIAAIFSALVAEHEKLAEVTVKTALELSGAQKKLLTEALEKRLVRKVNLHCELDKTLLAGAMIQIGDSVIDGSMRGKLARLKDNLMSEI